MKRWLGPLATASIAGVAAHLALLHLAPAYIMDLAMFQLAKRNIALHDFTAPQRITPQAQVVVRSSPDLFYSLCRYDLSDPDRALAVVMGEWSGYQSLSFFDAETNNFATYRASGGSFGTVLVPPNQTEDPGSIRSPTTRGVILIRRLAPTQESFDAASEAASSDMCRLLNPV
ncbi:MAG: DUF1254 domain-containing protein [Pseudomonadota bacterium]